MKIGDLKKLSRAGNLAKSGGLPVITIGKNGGKIVCYDKNNHPIYQGSVAAQQLAVEKGLTPASAGPFGIDELIDSLHSALGVELTTSKDGLTNILSLRVKVGDIDFAPAKLAAMEAAMTSRLKAACVAGAHGFAVKSKFVIKTAPNGDRVAAVLIEKKADVKDWSIPDIAPDDAHVYPLNIEDPVPFAKAQTLTNAIGQDSVDDLIASGVHPSWAGSILPRNHTILLQHSNGTRYTVGTNSTNEELKVTVTVPAGGTHRALAAGVANYAMVMDADSVKDVVLDAPKTLIFDTAQEAMAYVAGYRKSLTGKLIAEVNGLYIPHVDNVLGADKINEQAPPLDVAPTAPAHDMHVADHAVAEPVIQPVSYQDVDPDNKQMSAGQIAQAFADAGVKMPQKLMEHVGGMSVGMWGPQYTGGVVVKKTPAFTGHGFTAADKIPAAALDIIGNGIGAYMESHPDVVDPQNFDQTLVVHGADALGQKVLSVSGGNPGASFKCYSTPIFTSENGQLNLKPIYVMTDGHGSFSAPLDADDFAPDAFNADWVETWMVKSSGTLKVTAAAVTAAHPGMKMIVEKDMVVIYANGQQPIGNEMAKGTISLHSNGLAGIEVMQWGAIDHGDGSTSAKKLEFLTIGDAVAAVKGLVDAVVNNTDEMVANFDQSPEPSIAPAKPVEAVVSEAPIQMTADAAHKPVKPVVSAFPQHVIEDKPTNWPNWAKDYPPGTVCKAVDHAGNVWAVSLHTPDPVFADDATEPVEVVLSNLSDPSGTMHSGLSIYGAAAILDPSLDGHTLDDDAFKTVVEHYFAGLPIVIDGAGKTHLDIIPQNVQLALLGDDSTIVHPEDLAKMQAAHKGSTDGSLALPDSEVQNVVKPLKKKGAGLPEFLQQMAGGVQWKWQVEVDGKTDVVQLNSWFAKGTYAKPIVADLPLPTTWGDADITVLMDEDCVLTVEHDGKTYTFTPHLAKKDEDKGAALAKQLGFGSEWHLTQDELAGQDEAKPAAAAPKGKPYFANAADAAKHVFQTMETVKWLVDGPDGGSTSPVKISTWSKKGSYAPDHTKGLTAPHLWTNQTVDVVKGPTGNLVVIVVENGKCWEFMPVGSKADLLKLEDALTSIGEPGQEQDVKGLPIAQAPKPIAEPFKGVLTWAEMSSADSVKAFTDNLKVGDVLAAGNWKQLAMDVAPLGTVFKLKVDSIDKIQSILAEKTATGWILDLGEGYDKVPVNSALSAESEMEIVKVGTIADLPTVTAEEAPKLAVIGGKVKQGDQATMQALPIGTVLQYQNGTKVKKGASGWTSQHSDGKPGQSLKPDFYSSEDTKVIATPLATPTKDGHWGVGMAIPHKALGYDSLPPGTVIQWKPNADADKTLLIEKTDAGWPNATAAGLAGGLATIAYLPEGDAPIPTINWDKGDAVPMSETALAAFKVGTSLKTADGDVLHKVGPSNWQSANGGVQLTDAQAALHQSALSYDEFSDSPTLMPTPVTNINAESSVANVQIQTVLDKFPHGVATDEASKTKAFISTVLKSDGTLYVQVKGATWPIKELLKQAIPGIAWSKTTNCWTATATSAEAFADMLAPLHAGLLNPEKVVLAPSCVEVLQAAIGAAPPPPVAVEPKPIETVVPDEHHVPTSAAQAIIAAIKGTPGKWMVKAPGKKKFSGANLEDWADWGAMSPALAGTVQIGAYSTSSVKLLNPNNWDDANKLATVKHEIKIEDGVIYITKTYLKNGTTATWELKPPGGAKTKAKVHAAAIAYVPPASPQAKAAHKGPTPVQAIILDNVPKPSIVITKPAEPAQPGVTQEMQVHDAIAHWGYEIVHSGTLSMASKVKTDKGWVDGPAQDRNVIVAMVPEDATPLAGELMLLAAGVPTKMQGMHMVMKMPVIYDAATGLHGVAAPGQSGAVEKHCFVINKAKADTAKGVTLSKDANLGEPQFADVPQAVKEFAAHAGVNYHGLVKLTAKASNNATGVAAGDELFVVVSKSHMAVFRADGSLLDDYPVELGKFVQGKPNLIREVFDKHIGFAVLGVEDWQKYVQVLHAGSLKVPEPPEHIKAIANNEHVIPTQTAINAGTTPYHSTTGVDAPGAIYGVPLAKEPWQGYVIFGQNGQPDKLYDNGGNVIASGDGEVLAYNGWKSKLDIIQSAGTNAFVYKYEPKPFTKHETGEAGWGGIEHDSTGAFASRVSIAEMVHRIDTPIGQCEMEGKDAYTFVALGLQTGHGRVHRIKKLNGDVVNRVLMSLGAAFHSNVLGAARDAVKKGTATVGGGGYGSTLKAKAFQFDSAIGMFAEMQNEEQHYVVASISSGKHVPRTFIDGKVTVDGQQIGYRIFSTENDQHVEFEFPEGASLSIQDGARKALHAVLGQGGASVDEARCDVLAKHADTDLFKQFVGVRRFNGVSLAHSGKIAGTQTTLRGKATSLHDVTAGWHPTVSVSTLQQNFAALKNQDEANAPLKAVTHGGHVNFYYDLAAVPSIGHDPTKFYIKTGVGNASQGAAQRVLSVIENGLMGTRDRMSHLGATCQKGASIDSDVANGDADVAFLRPESGSGGMQSTYGGDITVYLNSSVILGDVLLTQTNGDSCGDPDIAQNAIQGKDYAAMADVSKTGTASELLPRSVPTSAMMSIAVSSGHVSSVVKALKDRGYHEINGVPVDQFIVSYSDKAQSKATLKAHVKKTYFAANPA